MPCSCASALLAATAAEDWQFSSACSQQLLKTAVVVQLKADKILRFTVGIILTFTVE